MYKQNYICNKIWVQNTVKNILWNICFVLFFIRLVYSYISPYFFNDRYVIIYHTFSITKSHDIVLVLLYFLVYRRCRIRCLYYQLFDIISINRTSLCIMFSSDLTWHTVHYTWRHVSWFRIRFIHRLREFYKHWDC